MLYSTVYKNRKDAYVHFYVHYALYTAIKHYIQKECPTIMEKRCKKNEGVQLGQSLGKITI